MQPRLATAPVINRHRRKVDSAADPGRGEHQAGSDSDACIYRLATYVERDAHIAILRQQRLGHRPVSA